MTSAFSSDETAVIERNIEKSLTIQNISEIWNETRQLNCLEWINQNDFKRICLQFPDNLLQFSIEIQNELSNLISGDIFILGDTSYGSCCVDEIAAEHINADAVIHFGHACLSKVVRLPVFYVFENFPLNIKSLFDEINQLDVNSREILVFYDIGYYYSLDAMLDAFKENSFVKFAKLALNTEPDLLGYNYGLVDLKKISAYLYIGRDDQSFFNLNVSLHDKPWYLCNPSSESEYKLKKVKPLSTTWLKRRYYYIEKCKDAQSIGIVVATLTANGYLSIVNHIQKLAKLRGIRTYLISVGKVNPAKLANFIDIDCFVLIGCSENSLFSSRDFYKPLVSPFEVEIALNPLWHNQMPDHYFIEFKELLPNGQLHSDFSKATIEENDVSLITGSVRRTHIDNDNNADNTECNALLERKSGQLMNSQLSFQHRSWNGLDPALGTHEPVNIVEGRAGLAMSYDEANVMKK